MTSCNSQALQDLEWAIGINRLSLRIYGTGIDTHGDNGWRTTVARLRVLVIFLSVVVLLLAPQTAALIKVWGHLLLMIDNLVTHLLFAVTAFELIILWRKNEVIVKMMEYIKCDWLRPKTHQERNVMLRYGQLSRIITIGGYFIITFAVLFYQSPVIFGFALRTKTNLTDFGDRPFVVQAIYPFDAYKSPVFEIVATSQFVASAISTYCYTTVSMLFGVTVLHVSSQLENLYNRIEDMGKNDEIANFQVEFRFNILEHERLIRFSQMIENTFSLSLLAIITAVTLILCLLVYQTIIVLGDDIQRPLMQVVFYINYVIYVVFTTFVYSAVGEVLVTQSEKIQHAVYSCEWYKLKPREAAQLIPILVRSQRPLVITAGKFVYITLPTFASLMKTAAGYVSVLLAVRD